MLTFLVHNMGVLTVVLHNTWFWPMYYIFNFDHFTTQHLILTFLLHSIGFWPVYCATLGFDSFTTQLLVLTNVLHNGRFWHFCYTTFDFDLFTTQHLISTFWLHNSWFRPFHYTRLDFDLLQARRCTRCMFRGSSAEKTKIRWVRRPHGTRECTMKPLFGGTVYHKTTRFCGSPPCLLACLLV